MPSQILYLDIGQGLSVRILAEIADTPEAIAKGLAGRKGLPKGEGMLFVFPQRGSYPMTMREMLFPLDMIFLDGAQVVGILSRCIPGDVRPLTIPLLFSAVLEVPGGFAAQHGIVGGSFLQ